MNITSKITLDLLQNNMPPRVSAKQNDKLTRFVEIALCVNGAPFDVPTETVLILRYKKADGTIGFYDTDENENTAFEINKNIVTATLAEQILTASGEVSAEINLYNVSGQRLTSFNFIIDVVAAAVSDKIIQSSNYNNILSAQIATAIKAESNSFISATNAANSELVAQLSAEKAQENALASNNSSFLAETKMLESAEYANSAFNSMSKAMQVASLAESNAAQSAFSNSEAALSKISAAESATSALDSKTIAIAKASAAALSAKDAAESAAKNKGISSVNNKLPDNNGNLQLAPVDVGALDIYGVASNTLKFDNRPITDFQLKTDTALNTTTKKIVGGINEAFNNSIRQYSHMKTGARHELIGTGVNIKFTATASYILGDTFTVNNVAVTAKNLIGFASGDIVTCFLNGNVLDFGQHRFISSVSTVEQWTGGYFTNPKTGKRKKEYERTYYFPGSQPSTAAEFTITTANYIEWVISQDHCYISEYIGTNFVPFPRIGATNGVSCSINVAKGVIAYVAYGGANSVNLTSIIRYTKTSDIEE